MGDMADLVLGARLIGPANVMRAVRYSVARASADRGAPAAGGPLRAPGSVRDARVDGSHVVVTFDDAVLELRFPRAGQVSVGWDGALAQPSYAVCDSGDPLEPELSRGGESWVARVPGLSVTIESGGALAYADATGAVRRSDGPVQWAGESWQVRTELPMGASVHGLGGRAEWDLRGGTFRLWNTDPGGAWLPGDDPLYVTTPAYAAIDDSGVVHCFVDDQHDGQVRVGADSIDLSLTGGPARWHVTLGSLPEVLDAFTALTGRPAVPPRWAFGFHQARWGYGSAAAVREVWEGFARHDLPLSAIHLDIDHMDAFRNFTFGSDWEGIDALVAAMAADEVRTVVIVDAGVARVEGYPQHDEGLAGGHFCRTPEGDPFEGVVWPGPTLFPDFTAEPTRRWWGDQLAFYAEKGVAGYWHDMNEPACFAASGAKTFPLSVRHDLDGRPADHRTAHNVYGTQMCRASYEGLLRLQPDRRPFLFSRSGWAGQQRYGGHWSGDIEADWSALPGTIHQAFGFGLGGVGYYGSDIGGFTGEPSPELFTRWFQLCSFMPFFRTHCAFHLPRREPWEWGEEVVQRLRTALRTRYRLLPYWYTLALAAGHDGAPLVRPLAWADPVLRHVDDQFLLGDDVLVAPVLSEGAASRRVTLPAGTWYDGDTGAPVTGEVVVAAGPDRIPWFLRAGSVLPTEEVVDGGRQLVLLVAPPDASGDPAPGGRLITDAGDGWEPPHQEDYRVTRVDGVTAVGRVVVSKGHWPFSGVAVRSVDGSPARLDQPG
jgi:alpha-glucosidase